MIHRMTVERYPGTLPELAHDLGDLRYDALGQFLESLAAKLTADAAADEARGRLRLSATLSESAEQVRIASLTIREAWRICSPRMGE